MMIDAIIAKVKGFIVNPVESFRAARPDTPDIIVPYFIALLLIHTVMTAIISLAGISVMGMLSPMMPGFAMPVVIFFGVLIGGAIVTILFSLWLHLWVYLLGGRKGLFETAKAVIYGMTPGMILGWIPFIGFLFCLWSIVLQIIGIRELQEMSSGKALVAMIIAVMVPLIVVVLLAMYFFVSMVSVSPIPVVP
ncbi:Yip1 family protein [Methanoregula sp.]|uniref:Yip1 family protein n=1 Tax=Methanoregula sp. TaxID=2052170 RepID=UPI00260C219D|nr:Yip1 family protein [Methanoregula sp.]MDD5142837.1 Yip1 family protein [Methanoregula sp.]